MSPCGELTDAFSVKQRQASFISEKTEPPHPVDVASVNGVNVFVDTPWKWTAKLGYEDWLYHCILPLLLRAC